MSAVFALAAAVVIVLAGAARGEPRVVHGADAVFVEEPVRIVWAILRGADEAATDVVLTVTGAGGATLAVAVDGVDPFSGARVPVAPAAALAGPRTIRVPRARFAEHPRTEVRFGVDPSALAAGAATLVVYFNSVPDAAPEFADERALSAYVGRALSGRPR